MAEATAQAEESDEAGVAADRGRAAISEEEVSALLENDATDRVVPYDLSSRRVSRTQLPMLDFLCRNFAERVAVSLSTLVSREVTMQFDGLQSAKTADLQAALPFPVSLAVIRIKPLPGLGFVSVDPALLLVLLDVFFGGQGRATSDPQAAAAPAAQRFLALLVRNFAADLTTAWAPITPVELELVKQETNPRFAQMGDPNSMMIAAHFAVTIGATAGRIDWLLPEALLAPIREALASESGKAAVRPQAPWAPVLGAMLQRAEIEARAILAEAQISLGELVRLVPGDVIPIEAPQQVTLLAGDVPLYRGKFGVSQGRNSLKILSRGSA
jgi:flagellar motor switch protein FliM